MKNGVSARCLQICVHDFRLTDEALTLALSCVDDITAMLLCSTDGRDHRPCCKNAGINDQCLDICNLQPGVTPSTALIPCAIKVEELSICFDEGKGLYPRPPEDVEVKTIEQYSIVIDWQEPGGGPNITSYTVEHSLDNSIWTKKPNTSLTYFALTKLTPNTRYFMRVTSNNKNGQSTPSNVLVAITKPVPSNKTDDDWLQLWQDRNECCQKSNISTDCQSMCQSGMFDELDTRSCFGDIDKIIACAADGRDHTNCCSRKIPGFSPSCLHYCKGQPGSRDVNAALCLTFIGPILSCFTEGQGLLPTPPQYVKAVASNSTEITMKWKQSASNCNSSCYYVTYIWKDSSKDTVERYRTKLNSYVFKNLSPLTKYRVAVAAYNGNGMSLPSPYIILTTPVDSQYTISVSHDPLGVVDNGTSVRLICASYGAKFDTVKWLRNKQTIENRNIHVIQEVTSKDEGLYLCNVTFIDGKMMSEDLYLNVRYKPVAKKMTEKTAIPNMGQDARLLCEFEGFPDTVIWTKDGNVIQPSLKYFPTLSNDYGTGKTTGALIVNNVTSADFGSYTCTGSNKFGKMHSTGSLRNFIPVTPTSAPHNKTEVSECCKSKGVPLDCTSAICTYDININGLFSNSALTHCANYVPEFLSCGSDGKDHTKCCSKDGVPEGCLPFCAGAVPDHNDQLELLVCLPHGDTLINCLVHGTQYIPSAPRNVHAKLLYDTVQVFWDAPEDNPDKVEVYHIYYKSKSLEKTFDAASKQSRSKMLQSDLIKKGETYIIWMKAVNDFGSSQMSEHTNITISGLVPPAPSNLQGNLLTSNMIEIKWTAPKTKLKITGYALHYQSLGGKELIVRPIQTETRLVGLKANTRYIISVAAVSADGEGQRTNTISITTDEAKPEIATVKPQPQTQETVGIVVGVILGLIFLVAIAIVAIILFRRMAQGKPTQNQTVAFENPHYASGQRVTGLPGENENGSFGYGKLNEEQDNEHMYVTMDNTQASSSTDTPATLDLS
ncbi:Ig-like and fibronectin type-III domain-containing protein 1 [Ruditapes philippinarum]|uniref:Ig-like and fibronectin type-III domain-containing protein 1 n=1 Tax=Ruditapes philippinarum TaxID=129788 RepID=UPI00295A87A9|nr:Ig-like and fibronectin type-III domain-containing protein 1 [Ruditapes philippinarum]